MTYHHGVGVEPGGQFAQTAGGAELTQFRHVHGTGLFPPRAVSDRDFAAINAWLRTLSRPQGRD
jgi:hypothetical protein